MTYEIFDIRGALLDGTKIKYANLKNTITDDKE